MSDVRCPMCGKPNPADAEACQFCQARIKPLVIKPASDPSAPAQPQMPARQDDDWLDSLRDEEKTSAGDEEFQAQGEDELEPIFSGASEVDWLENLRAEGDPDQDIEGEQTQAWLDEIRTGSLQDTEQGAAAEAEPEWLRRIRARQQSQEGEYPSGSEDSLEVDFLDDLRAESSEGGEIDSPDAVERQAEGEFRPQDVQPAPQIPGQSEDDTPDWLSSLSQGSKKDWDQEPAGDEGKVSPFTEHIDFPEEGTPEWLKELDGESPAGAPQDFQPEDQEPPAKETGDFPAWLADLSSTEPGTAHDEALTSAEGNEPAWLADFEVPEALDDEIRSLFADDKLSSDELPDNLLSSGLDEERLFDEVNPFEEELPDFTAGSAPSSETGDSFYVEPEPADDIERADLPTWLEAMRPVEAAATPPPVMDPGKDVIENKGPLAGLRGVLPVEPDTTRVHKAAALPIKLRVSDEQQRNAALFSDQIRTEGEPRPLPAEPVLSSQYILRVLIFVVLAAAILWPLVLNSQQMPLPEYAPENLETSTLISSLPPSAPVLVGVEYQPGLAAEMERAAWAAMDHLMINGAYLTLISTNPTGPVQAERFIQQVSDQGKHNYSGAEHYANLGYLAGDATGLLAFAQAPRQAAPLAADGSAVWTRAALENISQLEQFSLVMVITDSPDKARLWIEQIGTRLNGTPMVMILSAQAEPVVRPYYEGQPRLVHGMVAGLSGGAAYEGLMQRPGIARQSWDAFTIGLFAAVLLMAGGASFNLAATYWGRRNRRAGKGEE